MKKRRAVAEVEAVFEAVPTATEVRAFFYGIFMDDLNLRRTILRAWHSPYAPEHDDAAGPPKRVADLWTRFVRDVMYEPVRFCMAPDYMIFYGNGARSLRIAYAWLKPEQRQFLVWRVFAHRSTLFKTVKMGLNNEFFLDTLVYDQQHINSYIWQRELVRDFCWLVANRKSGALIIELICALQTLLFEHPRGKCDVFLLNLCDALQGRCLLEEAPCFGLTAWDLHPEERADREEQMKRGRVIYLSPFANP